MGPGQDVGLMSDCDQADHAVQSPRDSGHAAARDDLVDAARDDLVDVARGVTIIAIVLGHVVLGLMAADMSMPEESEDLTRGLYLFRLSTLAYLAGLFVRRGVERLGGREFAVRRVLLFGWLYVLWSILQGSVKALAGSLTNIPVAWGDVLRLWIPEGQLWFLPWLIGATLVAVLARPWESRRRTLIVLAAAAVLAVAVWGWTPPWVFSPGWALVAPFALGCVVTGPGHARAMRRLGLAWCLAVAGGAIWLWASVATSAVPPTLGGMARTPSGVALGVVGCVTGTAGALAGAALLARTPARAVLSPVGRRSLEIFLAHIIFASGTRIILVQAGVTDLGVHLLLGVLLGVLAPMALAVVVEQLGWKWVFGLPDSLRRMTRRSDAPAGMQPASPMLLLGDDFRRRRHPHHGDD